MMFGGVPFFDNVQNPIIGDSEGIHLVVPRSSTKECIDFICKDLQTAADYLPARWESENKNFGRITSGAALALKGRVELYMPVRFLIGRMMLHDGKLHIKQT